MAYFKICRMSSTDWIAAHGYIDFSGKIEAEEEWIENMTLADA